MARVGVLYGTTEGHTAKVAQHIGDAARRLGHEVEVRPAAELPDGFTLDGYDHVFVGGSVHEGKHQRSVRKLITKHRQALEAKGAAFFSVSLAAATWDPHGRAESARYIDDMTAETGWRPAHAKSIAGALLYTEYNFLKRLLMRTIVKVQGGPSDTSKDYEYTDWEAVTLFVEQVLEGA
jgi:menaquinone-dependent protoporphyrinogen oxidase